MARAEAVQGGRVADAGGSWTPLRRIEALWALFFISPALLGLLAFTIIPVIASLLLSFVNWNMIREPEFIGLDNYAHALSDATFWKVMFNTTYYTLGTVPTGIALSLALAVMLNQKLRGVTFLRTLYFLPVVSSTVAVALVWRTLYNPDWGIINYALSSIGIPPIGWLTTTTWAMPAVILMSVWKGLGYNMVIFLAGMQGIPRHLYDAAAVDGATAWQRFWHITLPLLSPTTFFVTVISVIGSFQVFQQVYVMTSGGPAKATSTIVFYLYEQAFLEFKMGYASALAWLLFAVIFIFTLIQFRYQREWVYYE
ncbi:MAG TPA: sugar ABC transporter permease [Chloroflexota bacterium]|nr:sugar ABC transporter permease [Chloroflexota bacterium]